MPEKFLNLGEAAEILHISEDRLNELVQQGKIPAYKIAGQFLRFDKEQVEKYVGSLSTSPPPTTQAKKEDNYKKEDRLVDFLYFNDFYIISFVLIVLILLLIFH